MRTPIHVHTYDPNPTHTHTHTDIAENVYTGGDATRADAVWRSMLNAGAHSGVLYVASSAPEPDVHSGVLYVASSAPEPDVHMRPEAMHAIGLWFPPGQMLYST